MEKLSKSQRKKIINEALKDFFKREGMSKYDIWDNGYTTKKDLAEENVYIGLFTFKTSLQETSYIDFLHIKKIENIIEKIQHPNYNWDEHKKRNVLLQTIHLSYFSDLDTAKKLIRSRLDWTEEDCLQFASNIIEYFETKITPSLSYYCHLPNILKEMDKLESEGKYWSEIIEGGGTFLFKGLIISKLCNDPNYQSKEAFVYKMFHDEIDEWTPYCDKLIDYLKGVDPIYNI